MSTSLFDISVRTIEGPAETLAEYKGNVMLIVNVASACGLTPQYLGLEKIYEAYMARGFVVLGFPCNDFGGQEPGTELEIQRFCEAKFNVQFPMFSKITVKGEARHPLYVELIAQQPKAQGNPGSAPKEGSDISWNFEKFLVGRDGKVIARFAPQVTPESPILIEAIEAALAAEA
jgi:glutathione peroxidase